MQNLGSIKSRTFGSPRSGPIWDYTFSTWSDTYDK